MTFDVKLMLSAIKLGEETGPTVDPVIGWEIPGDDSRAKRASWVQRRAGEIDTREVCNEESKPNSKWCHECGSVLHKWYEHEA